MTTCFCSPNEVERPAATGSCPGRPRRLTCPEHIFPDSPCQPFYQGGPPRLAKRRILSVRAMSIRGVARLHLPWGLGAKFGAGLRPQVRRGSLTPPKGPNAGLPKSGDLRSATWLGQRPATDSGPEFGAGPDPKFGGSLTPPKGPTVGLPEASGDLRSAAWLGQRPATTDPKFGAGL